MTESIGEMLVTRVGLVVPLFLAEAATEAYPYAVYELTATQFRTKDGVYKITAEPRIRIYDTDFDTADTKATAIRAAVEISSDQYIVEFRSVSKDCVDGVWVSELVYFVKQVS